MPYTPGRTFAEAYEKGFNVGSRARALFEDREAKKRAETAAASVMQQLQATQSPVAAAQAVLDEMEERRAAGEHIPSHEWAGAKATAAIRGFKAIESQMNIVNNAILSDPTNKWLKESLQPIMQDRAAAFEQVMGVMREGEILAEKRRAQTQEHDFQGHQQDKEHWWKRTLQEERLAHDQQMQDDRQAHDTWQAAEERKLKYYGIDIRAEADNRGLDLEERRVELAEKEWASLSAERQFKEFLTGMEVVATAQAAGIRDEEIARRTGLSLEDVRGMKDQYAGMTQDLEQEIKTAQAHLDQLKTSGSATPDQVRRVEQEIEFLKARHQEAYDAELRSRQRKLEHGAILGSLYEWGSHASRFIGRVGRAPTYLWKAPAAAGRGVMDPGDASPPKERAWDRASE